MRTDLTTRQRALARAASSEVEKTRFVKGGEIILADGSGSMETRVEGTNPRKTRWQCLCEAIASYGPDTQTIVYENDLHYYVGIEADTPRPFYGTVEELRAAIKSAIQFEPNYVLVIGDGELVASGDERDSLNYAAQLAEFAIIDTLYIGEDNQRAEAFMKQLAGIGLGRYTRYDTSKKQQMQLTQVIAGLLPPPSTVRL